MAVRNFVNAKMSSIILGVTWRDPKVIKQCERLNPAPPRYCFRLQKWAVERDDDWTDNFGCKKHRKGMTIAKVHTQDFPDSHVTEVIFFFP